jgi:hypothetical protein
MGNGAYAKRKKKEIWIYHPPLHVLLKISKSSEIKVLSSITTVTTNRN